MVSNAIRYVIEGEPSPMSKNRTACGMVGWFASSDEYDTAIGTRFEAVRSPRQVTCKRCLAKVSP